MPGEPETFVVGEIANVLETTAGHDDVAGIEVRDASRADILGMQVLSPAVWHDEAAAKFEELFVEMDDAPDKVRMFVAMAEQAVVSFGWVHLPPGDFATIWGGSTLARFRGRGLYGVLVRRRAAVAQQAGRRYLQVDCTPDSRRILERLGFCAIEITTPYRWEPPT